MKRKKPKHFIGINFKFIKISKQCPPGPEEFVGQKSQQKKKEAETIQMKKLNLGVLDRITKNALTVSGRGPYLTSPKKFPNGFGLFFESFDVIQGTFLNMISQVIRKGSGPLVF